MKTLHIPVFSALLISIISFSASLSAQNKINDVRTKLPEISYTLSGDDLVAIAEKHLYKTTPQSDLYLYILHPQEHSKKPVAAIIYFYGGGWVKGTVNSQIPNAAWFRDKGIVGICADYRVKSRQGTTPIECVRDAKSAVRYIRANSNEFGIDPDKIIVAGGSAGGHIAACTAIPGGDEPNEDTSVSSKPNALVLHNPVLGEGFGKEFFAAHPEFSPISSVKKGWPPTILSCGTADRTTPFVYAQKFTDLMKAAGNTCELIPVKDADHSCDWPVSNINFLPTLTRMTEFYRKMGSLLKGSFAFTSRHLFHNVQTKETVRYYILQIEILYQKLIEIISKQILDMRLYILILDFDIIDSCCQQIGIFIASDFLFR